MEPAPVSVPTPLMRSVVAFGSRYPPDGIVSVPATPSVPLTLALVARVMLFAVSVPVPVISPASDIVMVPADGVNEPPVGTVSFFVVAVTDVAFVPENWSVP